MTERRLRDLHKLLTLEAAPYGASVSLEHTSGGHLRGTFTVGSHHTFIITSFTPSSTYRQHRHVRADARRALRRLTSD